MPADQIFVLVLIAAIVLGLGWLSIDSRRRAEVERQRNAEALAAIAATASEVREPVRAERRQRRRR